jgi:hypothetical protein
MRPRTLRFLGPLFCAALVAGLFVMGVGTHARSGAAEADTYTLTLAARSCPTYTDISANQARNNIMESLQDLGPDTTYSPGELVSPTTEASVQPNCTPITGWSFTLGNGIAGQVTGPWGALSVVSNPDSPPPVTEASTPLLDNTGNPTGQQIDGAVTVTLTAAQVQLADAHSLWVQGGLVNDPIENTAFPSQYGFGALRCAIDNLNGDNVEWVGYPQGVTHVFCFAYYVEPPPTSGTIVVTKKVPAGNTDSQTFNFNGTVSYNPGGDFSLDVVNGAPASATFYRAGGATPWTVEEQVPVNWQLTSLVCTSADSTSTVVTAGPLATITLADGDTVTCVYTDAPIPPAALTIRKVSFGGVGTFPFTITGAGTASISATTVTPGVPVDAGPTNLTTPGQYTITEDIPTATGGTWDLTSVECDGTDYTPSGNSVTITAVAGTEPLCTFTDTFIPDGVITVHKVMTGGLGAVEFAIDSDVAGGISLLQTANPSSEGVPALAVGDDSTSLPLGTYTIEELTPDGTSIPVDWSLTGVTCNGVPATVTGSSVTVTLTASGPTADCVFSDAYTPPTPPTTTTTTVPTTTTTVPSVPVAPESPVTNETIPVTG